MDEHRQYGHANSVPKWLVALLAVGLTFRLVAAWASPGIMHPDEHQQYIEQSFRLVHGYGATYWEQDTGLRHPLFTMFLAGILWVEEHVGISDPSLLAAGQRIVLAVLSYAALATLVWSVYSRGRHVAGLVLAVLLVCSIDLIFIQVRVMTENATVAVLAFALACWLRRPVAAGLLLGTMVALRLQTAPMAVGLWAVAGWDEWTSTASVRRWAALTAGLAGAIAAMGGIDLAYYGEWFHSARTNIRLQALGDVATSYGTSPVYAYVLTGGIALARASIFALPCLALGAWRRPALAAVAVLFFVAHYDGAAQGSAVSLADGAARRPDDRGRHRGLASSATDRPVHRRRPDRDFVVAQPGSHRADAMAVGAVRCVERRTGAGRSGGRSSWCRADRIAAVPGRELLLPPRLGAYSVRPRQGTVGPGGRPGVAGRPAQLRRRAAGSIVAGAAGRPTVRGGVPRLGGVCSSASRIARANQLRLAGRLVA